MYAYMAVMTLIQVIASIYSISFKIIMYM